MHNRQSLTGSFQPLFQLGPHQAPVYALAEGLINGQLFTGGGDRVVAHWDMISGNQLPFTVRTDASIYSLFLHRQTNHLFIGCANGKLHVVDVHSKKEVFAWSIDTAGVFDLKVDPFRNRLLAAGGNGIITVIDLTTFDVIRSIPLSDGKLRRLAINADGNALAVADSSGPVHILDAESFQTKDLIHSHAEGASAVAWHPTKPVIVSGGKDAFIRCHSSADGFKQVLSFAAHQSTIYDIVYHAASDCFVSCSRDKVIKWWNTLTFDPLRKASITDNAHKHSVNRLLSYEQHVISASDDRRVLVFGV